MSRARNIKPGFFKNELLVELPFEYRLLFIGLWTMADRDGRLEDRPTKIRMELFPADAVDVNAGLQALHNGGFILRYGDEGRQYIQVLAWSKHQNPHVKEAKSTIPAPCLHGAGTVQAPTKESASRADSLIPDSLIPEKEQKTGAARAPTPAELFPDVDPSHLRDWLAARKAKRLPLTETAAKGFRRAAAKAGMTAAEAVRFCAEKGWAGLHPESMPGSQPRGSPSGQQVGKTMQGIMALEGLKRGNRMAAGPDRRGDAEALLPGPRKDSGG